MQHITPDQKPCSETPSDSSQLTGDALDKNLDILNEVERVALIGGWKMDVITGKATWTQGTYAIAEIAPSEPIPGLNEHVDYYLPEYRSLVSEAMRALIEDDKPLDFSAQLRTAKGNVIWCHVMAKAVRRGGKAVEVYGTFQDVTAQKQAEEELQFRNVLLSTQQEASIDGILVVDEDARIISYNRRFIEIMNIPAKLVEDGDDEPVLKFVTAQMADPKSFLDRVQYLYEHRQETSRDELVMVDGRILDRYSAPMFGPNERYYGRVWYFRDISERKQSEAYREMSREILQLLNEPGDLPSSIKRVLAVLKARIGFDAMGIRLQEGSDFPYFLQEGFPGDFLLKENTLAGRTRDGGVCRDKDGNISLECTCGLVVSGKADPSSPLFTQGGSFWTNDSFPLLDIPPGEDPRLNPRNQCIHQGYASVALVPIRNKDRIVGLIQMNDRRKGRFSIEMVQLLEEIAGHIGDALMRKQAEDAFRVLSLRQEAIFDAVPEIIMEVDGNKVYTWANRSGFEFFGTDVIGKKAEEYFMGDQDVYSIVQPLFNGNERIIYLESWQRRKDGEKRLLSWWCRVLKDKNGHVIGALSAARDITEFKRAEAENVRQLDELRRWQTVMLGREGRINELKQEVNALAVRLGESPRYGCAAAG